MRRAALVCLALSFSLAAAAPALAAPTAEPGATSATSDSRDVAAIKDVITRMEAAWNRGDFRGYMDGFWNPGVTFVSKGRILSGWQDTLDHYVRDYDTPEKRGHVHFSDITVQMLAPDAAQLVSHYRLERAGDPQDGINTRLFRRIDGRWVIALNHVSAKEPAAEPAAQAPGEIEAVLQRQVSAWNRGDFDAFMAGYWNSSELKFVSGSKVTTGWAETLAHYKTAYATPEKRGTLTFSDLDVKMLAVDAAVVLGRWHIAGPQDASGAFTLTFRRIGGDWVIVLDHTS